MCVKIRHRQPEVDEINVVLTPYMKAIQSAILVAVRSCINELKRSAGATSYIHELDELLTMENGFLFSAGLDSMIRRVLDPDWHRISYRYFVCLFLYLSSI